MAGVDRRAFVKLMGCLAGAVVALPLIDAERKYGHLVAGEYRCRVSLDGVEITNQCREADDIQGYAICMKRDEQGKLCVEDGKIATERLTGDVRIWDVHRWRSSLYA